MNKTFALGALSGVAALGLAAPIAVHLVGAATPDSPSTPVSIVRDVVFGHPPSRVEDIQKMIDRDQAILENIDEIASVVTSATQTRKAALTAALSITDDTQRAEAVKAANDAFHASLKAAVEANPELKDALPFGGKRMGHGFGVMRRGPAPEMLAEKLGMTADELKAALESGKTLEEIVEEKGVELPRFQKFKIRLDGFLEEKLGMSAEELKAELDSGKTIEQIAEEKGVELPARPMMKVRAESTTSAQ